VCGFHVELQANHTSEVLAGNAMIDAVDNNADLMVTPCPLCHLKMDTYQDDIGKVIGRDVELPVLHMPPDGSFSFRLHSQRDWTKLSCSTIRRHILEEVKLNQMVHLLKTIYTPARVWHLPPGKIKCPHSNLLREEGFFYRAPKWPLFKPLLLGDIQV